MSNEDNSSPNPVNVDSTPQDSGQNNTSTEISESSRGGNNTAQESNVKPIEMSECSSCGGNNTAQESNVKPTYVYAIGLIQPRFPNLSIEKEFYLTRSAGDTMAERLKNALSPPENRYLARKLCWTFLNQSAHDTPVYIIVLKDPLNYMDLVNTIRTDPAEIDKAPVDMIVGTRGAIARPEVCNGLQVPLVYVDQLYSFSSEQLVKRIPKRETKKKAGEEARAVQQNRELFRFIVSLADNTGSTNEYRALNFLAVRYGDIYLQYQDMINLKNRLSSIDVTPSSLSVTRTIVNVIFSFTNNDTNVTTKFAVAVDVTEEFPFLVSALNPYYDKNFISSSDQYVKSGLVPGNPVDLIKLRPLMNKTSGIPKIKVGLIDGMVDMTNSTLNRHTIRIIKQVDQIDDNNNNPAITHGTFVAGILCARRDTSQAPAICPNCTIIIRPIFNNSPKNDIVPSCDPKELSAAMVETVDAGANIINLSVGVSNSSFFHIKEIQEAYDYALKNDTIPIVAAGNQANVGQVSIIDHPWVIPVSACDTTGRISSVSNFGPSIGKRGIMAPGVGIKSILPKEKYGYMTGTSFAAPFVTGTIALLWSLFPKISSTHILRAVLNMSARRHAIVPPILNAELALKALES